MKRSFFNLKVALPLISACVSLAACNKASVSVKSESAISFPSITNNLSVAANPNYQLIWSDEFNVTGTIDTNKWSYCPRGSNSAWCKYMTASTAYASQDGANLSLRMDSATIPDDPIAYHSGGVRSIGKFNIAYGKIEVRAKFTQGQGSWPAIWMMPEPATAHSSSWPACGEMDIMEHLNYESVIHETVHNSTVTNANGASTATHTASYNTASYNIYTLQWSPSSVQFYVNNVLQYTYNKVVSGGWQQYPYDVPFYIILNQSGGAGWPGAINNVDLPFSMQVDYVRVYKLSQMTNGSFETGALSPWTSWGGTISVVTGNARTGTYAIKETGAECSIEQLVTGLSPNTTYIFSGWGKVSAAGQAASIGAKNYGGSAVAAVINTTSYTQGTVTFTTGATNTSATLYYYKASTGTVYGDDFYLEQQ